MADEIIVKYVADVKQMQKALDGINKRLDKIEGAAKDTGKEVEKSFSKMSTSVTSNLKKIGAAIGLAFGTQQLIQFGKEAVQAAAAAEGINRAFERIGSPKLLADLRKATRGTVSDLELMKKAVQASNFKLPLDSLAKLFKFAAARARETGESVDYLVNSIVLGIGRKSPLILDNLGISAVELRTRLKGVGVEAANVADIAAIVGEIATEELDKMGKQADTTADKMAQLTSSMANMKVEIGQELIEQMTKLAESWGVIETEADEAKEGVEGFKDELKELASDGVVPILGPLNILGKVFKQFKETGEVVIDTIERMGRGNRDYADFTEDAERATALFNQGFVKQDEVITEAIHNLAYYNDLIKKLKADQLDANITRAEVRRLEDEINEAIRQRLILLGKLREVGGASMEQIESIASAELEVQQTLTDDILADYAHRNKEIEKAQEALNASLEQARIDRVNGELETTQEALGTLGTLYSGFFELISTLGQASRDAELADLKYQLEQGSITREQFAEKEKNIRRKEAAQNKDAAIFQATIASLQAVVNALGSYPFSPANIAIAAAVGAAGAAQIAAIASTPLPQYAEGVIDLQGAGTGTSDSISAKLSKGESVMTAKETRIHKALFKSIRSNSYDDFIMKNHVAPVLETIMNGGMGALGASYGLNNTFNDKNMLKATDRLRGSNREDAKYIVSELRKPMKRVNRWN